MHIILELLLIYLNKIYFLFFYCTKLPTYFYEVLTYLLIQWKIIQGIQSFPEYSPNPKLIKIETLLISFKMQK